MAEPFFRFAEMVVPPIIALQGTKLKFEGLDYIPERGGALVALNHTSYLDWLPASIAAKERGPRLRFMIKAEMADVKAVNYVIKHAQLIPVDRRQGHDAYEVAIQRLRQGELIGLHPEATISRSYELREFKTGTARMALAARVRIVPLIVWGRTGSGRRTAQRVCCATRFRLRLRSARPLPPHPPGEFWVPRRLGGGAPDRDHSQALRFAELQERAQRYGSDRVTRPVHSRSGLH